MRRHVWGNHVISHFAVPGQNLFLSLNPHAKQAPRIAAVASRWHKRRPLSLSRSLFSQMLPTVWGEQRRSMPLTVDFGNQRWVSAQRKLLRTPAPVSGMEALLPVLISISPVLSWLFLEAVRFSNFWKWVSFSRLNVFTRGPCCSKEFTAGRCIIDLDSGAIKIYYYMQIKFW